MTSPWYFSYDWQSYVLDIFAPCMLSNPCRYLDESNSMRLQPTHILSNLHITKSLLNGGWRQGSTKPFKHILWQILCWASWLSLLDTQVLFLARTNPWGRWTQIPSGAPNSWWTTSTLSIPHKFNYMVKINIASKICHSILEKLYSESWAKATRQDVNTSRCLNEKW